ncbi:hypothetical protein [Terrimonas pollutisoli]|uniref:hypothetical protein n=1 Tax=Terrimonas pollutisoli TaxID=3034147 RepID=UPI0023EC7CEA|nr:hypothetical protein [Terrimonas sp. H1YJ31]
MLDKHLTDEEIQRFLLDGKQSNSNMADHLRVCNDCKARVATYELLFAGIAEQEKPCFEFNLAELVVAQLPKKQVAADRLPIFLLAFVMILLGGAGYVFRQYLALLFAGIGSLAVYLMIISVFVILLFFCLDMYKNYQRKMQALDLV